MEREIKFRAWDEMYHKMIIAPPIWSGSQSLNQSLLNCQQHEMILMQYTGLKDKNGTEIWEGDLLSVPYISSRLFEVFFVDGTFKGKHDISTSLLRTLVRENHAEIVGNIYENPDLLTPAKAAA